MIVGFYSIIIFNIILTAFKAFGRPTCAQKYILTFMSVLVGQQPLNTQFYEEKKANIFDCLHALLQPYEVGKFVIPILKLRH